MFRSKKNIAKTSHSSQSAKLANLRTFGFNIAHFENIINRTMHIEFHLMTSKKPYVGKN